MSSLVSGLLTIGPRFGGAIDDAARRFSAAVAAGQSPEEYVEAMKAVGLRVPGIGHRIKSKDNRDARVALLSAYARKFFSSTNFLQYAEDVETYTLTKAANLVLNVDGCIGALFLDLLHSCGLFEEGEIKQVLEIGYLNGLLSSRARSASSATRSTRRAWRSRCTATPTAPCFIRRDFKSQFLHPFSITRHV